MEKKLGNDWKNVSLSHATMKTEDVFKNLVSYFPEDENVQAIVSMAEAAEEDLDYLCWELLFDYLNTIAPEGCYFGAHPGDGSDYGFWAHDDEEE